MPLFPDTLNNSALKIFLDTNVYISALASDKGASDAISFAAEAGAFEVFISPEIIEEGQKTLIDKFDSPELFIRFQNFIKSFKPKITRVSKDETEKAAHFCYDINDVVILAAAIKSPANFLITLDKKAFKKKLIESKTGVVVVNPKEFMKIFRKIIGDFGH